MAFIEIDQLVNLHDGYRKLCVVNQQELLLIQEQGQRYLVQAGCPHLQWPLITGAIENERIYCKKHGYAFDLYSGAPANEQAMQCSHLKVFRIAYERSAIGLEMGIND